MTATRTSAPFLRSDNDTLTVMTDVGIALIPPSAAAIRYFGLRAFELLLIALLTSLAADRIAAVFRHNARRFDGSALISGWILALSCPPRTPPALLALLCLLTVWLFREAFGGIGRNLFNPAMAARAVLLTVFPAHATGYALSHAVSSATPLTDASLPLSALFWGRVGGSIGETSVPMLLLGGGYLLARRVIPLKAPLLSLGAFAAVTALGGGDVLRGLMSGSILFASIYIFTDYTGRPTTRVGEALFAVGCGALTALLRLYGRYPEGVCFAVLLMNLLTLPLEECTHPRVYGYRRKEKTL